MAVVGEDVDDGAIEDTSSYFGLGEVVFPSRRDIVVCTSSLTSLSPWVKEVSSEVNWLRSAGAEGANDYNSA
jgi:hypothetical protein